MELALVDHPRRLTLICIPGGSIQSNIFSALNLSDIVYVKHIKRTFLFLETITLALGLNLEWSLIYTVCPYTHSPTKRANRSTVN